MHEEQKEQTELEAGAEAGAEVAGKVADRLLGGCASPCFCNPGDRRCGLFCQACLDTGCGDDRFDAPCRITGLRTTS